MISRLKFYLFICLFVSIQCSSAMNYTFFISYYVKYSGLFDRHVKEDYSVLDCVHFLNSNGIKVDWISLYQNKPFDLKSMARISGQTYLMFSGEKKSDSGFYELPENFNSWPEFCLLNDLKYIKTFNKLLEISNNL